VARVHGLHGGKLGRYLVGRADVSPYASLVPICAKNDLKTLKLCYWDLKTRTGITESKFEEKPGKHGK